MATIPAISTATQAESAETFVDSLGVNTHIDFQAYGYQDLATTEAAIRYLGLVNLRDDPENPADVGANGWWQQVATATGAKFDAFLAEGSVAQMQGDLPRAVQLAQQGIVNFIEGGNEEDDPYATSNGNSLAAAAAFQANVYAAAHNLGLPAINMSFGQGWTAANNWAGDYDKAGNLSAYADYANAHTYPSGAPASTIQLITTDANIAAPGRPVIQTEFGYDTSQIDATTAAKYTLDGLLDSTADGVAKTYLYALFDDGSGQFGLMNADGTSKPAGLAIHDMTTLLADPGAGAGFTPGTLSYGLTGTTTGDNSLLFQKSDGSDWIAIWNEQQALGASHTITLNLASPAATITVFDPLTGTSAFQTLSNATTAQITLPDHPVLVEVIPAGTSTPPPSTGGGGGTTTPTSQDLAVAVPGAQTLAAGATLAVGGVSINDPWAASAGGSMALNVYDTAGTITIAGHTYGPGGGKVGGGMLSGTEAQLNADLATLAYTAGASAGADTLSVDVWNQAGVEVTQTIAIAVTQPAPVSPELSVPASETLMAGTSLAVKGVAINDPGAATAAGTMSLNVYDTAGTITIAGHTYGPGGGKVAGGMLSGTEAQLNADLATLAYKAGAKAGSDTLTVDVWNQAGVETTRTIPITITTATVLIPAGQASFSSSASNTLFSVTTGSHAIFIGGTYDQLVATGGAETVTALKGHNTIRTGASADTINIGGSGNVVDAGGGTNTISDAGSANTLVLPAGGTGMDTILGPVLQAGDLVDLRTVLAHTTWNGSTASLGAYLSTRLANGTDTIVSVKPGGASGGTWYDIARFSGAGSVSLATLTSHAIL